MRFSFMQTVANILTRRKNGSKSVVNIAKIMAEHPMVSVEQGALRGTEQRLLDGSLYYSFKGIPYAQVPARFAAPVPLARWEGVFDAIEHGPKCHQYDMVTRNIVEGDENCLFLNVYTRSLKLDAKIPVMIFIHGGGFLCGSGNIDDGFGPEFLLPHDVILVTINYRLEVLGFLCLDTPEVPGNAGMKDQVEALKWVKSNIKRFGGDPENITIFGESAGAASVTFHLQSSMSKGLFSKAIAQSGVSLLDWAQGKGGKERAFRAAKYLGNNSKDTTEVLEFLRSVPASKLAKLTLKTTTEDEKHRGLPIHFSPVVEKKFNNVEPFISEEPIESLISGQISKVPLMIGYNSDESILMLGDILRKLDFTNNNLGYLVPRQIVERITEEKTQELGKRIRKFYVGDREFKEEDAKALSDMMSDIHFVHSIQRFANFYSKWSPTYMYKFSCDTELNVVKNFSGYSDMKGASHADELFYLFYSERNSYPYGENPKLKDVVYQITKLWTDFAKTGNPTPDDSLGEIWSLYTTSKRAFLNIDVVLTSGVNPEKARVDFWDKIYCEVGLPCVSKSSL